MSTSAAGSNCANCGAALAGPFCSACGQRARAPNPTARDIAEDFAGEVFNVDGKIFRSVWLLFARPGFLTREAFADRRAGYVSPLRLYLIFSVLFFAALALAPDLIHVNYTYTPSAGEQVDPAVVAQKKVEVRDAVNDATNRWVPNLMFVLMPAFAALVMLFRRGSGRTYPQHLYFAMHVHAVAFFAATVAVGANIVVIPFASGGTKAVALIFAGTHFARAFRRAYETTWFGMVWRTALISVLYSILLFAVLLSIWLPVALSVFKQPI